MKPVHLTHEAFLNRVARLDQHPQSWQYLGDKPAIIDFYANWCGPCQGLSPVLEELADEYDGKAYIYKVDVDREQDLAAAFGVRSIPTLLFVPMQGMPRISVGALPKSALKAQLDKLCSAQK